MAEVNTTPTSASPWMMGANFGPNPGTPGIVSSPDAPNIGQPAMAGLSGTPLAASWVPILPGISLAERYLALVER